VTFEASLKGWGAWVVIIGLVVAFFGRGDAIIYTALAIIAAGLTQVKIKRTGVER
jgi:hypothetical protein